MSTIFYPICEAKTNSSGKTVAYTDRFQIDPLIKAQIKYGFMSEDSTTLTASWEVQLLGDTKRIDEFLETDFEIEFESTVFGMCTIKRGRYGVDLISFNE